MKKALRGKRVFLDTNIFVYVALKHPDFYDSCYEILELSVDEYYHGYGSDLVLFELFGALSKINPKAAYEAAISYLNLPITRLEINRDVIKVAYKIAEKSGVTYDSIHAATMMINGINLIITEDLTDWIKIKKCWKNVAEELDIKISDLIIYAPSKQKFI